MQSAVSWPALRPDLVFSEQAQAGGSAFVVKDPETRRFFRFREMECFIARSLDGRTPPETIQERVGERFGASLARETIDEFIASLRRLGLLEGDGAPAARSNRRAGGSLLYLRFPAFDPDRLLARLAPRLGLFFTPGFVLASVLLVLAGVATTWANAAAIERDIRGLWRFDALLFAWFTVLLVTAVHEFGHGLTCRRFGGEVHEMGFMLIYFQPAFYCNVSDAWLFPRKSRRLWVTLSGAWIEILIWALATLAWRVTAPGTRLSFMALVVMATSGIKSFFNMNPLIKLDGYYLLSDWLGIPNLRAKSMAYLGGLVRRPFRKARPESDPRTPRERRVFLIYGLLAGVYSSWLLGYIALWFGRSLTERYHGIGFILFGGILMTMFHDRIARLWTGAGALLRSVREPGGWKRPAPLLAAAPVVAAILILGHMELTVAGDVRTMPRHNADVTAVVEGIVDVVEVDEGERLEAGQVVARLVNRDLIAEKEQIDGAIAEKRADLALRLSRASSAVDQAQARRVYAGKHLRRADSLRKEGLISPQEYDQIEEDLVLRGKELEEAEHDLRRLGDEGPGREGAALALARAELERLTIRRRQLEEQIGALVIATPAAGVVTTPRQVLHDLKGRFVGKGTLIAEVHDYRTVTAEITIPEKDIGDVHPGQSVRVRTRAFPEAVFEGRVVSVAAAASRPEGEGAAAPPAGGERTFLVTTALDNPSLLLKPGMTGYAKIDCGRRSLLDLLRRGITGYLRVEFWSWW